MFSKLEGGWGFSASLRGWGVLLFRPGKLPIYDTLDPPLHVPWPLDDTLTSMLINLTK